MKLTIFRALYECWYRESNLRAPPWSQIMRCGCTHLQAIHAPRDLVDIALGTGVVKKAAQRHTSAQASLNTDAEH